MKSDSNITRMRYSKTKQILMVAFWLGLAIGAGYVLLGEERFLAPGSWKEFVLWAAFPLFILLALNNFVRLLQSGAVLTVGPEGISDRRIGRRVIPWDQIEGLSIVTLNKSRFCHVLLQPGFEAAFPFSLLMKLNRRFNKNPHYDGLMIHTQGLTGSFDGFWQAVTGHCPKEILQ